jgi:hypothetical protein
VLAGQQLPGSYELVSALLEVLARVAALPEVPQSELRYIEQLLMTGIESTALQIKVNKYNLQFSEMANRLCP